MGKPRGKRPILPAGAVLELLFKKRGGPLSEGYFLSQLNNEWKELAGEAIAQTGRPIRFKRGLLVIALPSSSHIQEMRFVSEPLRQKINRRFPEKNIRKITFQLSAPESKNSFRLMRFKQPRRSRGDRPES